MPSHSYTLRQPTSGEAEALSALICSSWTQAFGHAVPASVVEEAIAGPLSPSTIEQQISDPSTHFLVASFQPQQGSEQIIGVAQLRAGLSEACLQLPNSTSLRKLYVDAAHHGTGVARDLLLAAEETARKDGWSSIWLTVWEGNARGKRFYEKMGYEVKGQKPSDLRGGSRGIVDFVMEKAL
ncbi:acyl-CoA N-acyltransferase [Dioszegia hungarica]|uniref:Acyl-CoA N-acyltransferase n=1 Tax=Dioszegia hungarica TaxID=4972 RepID=A0AA38H8T3_9TREE|nr:acyl-CoA N-acyltransferase [Dioszegia hungarica]KAI9635556.1 acyl-CoA N-acyltransferase [Dioszegia hungarica]